MNAYVRFYIYTAVLCFAVFSAFTSRNRDLSFRCLKLLLTLTLIAEVTAHILAVVYRNNMVVYQLFVPLQLVLVGWYYHYSNPVLRKFRIGIIITIAGIVAAVTNVLLLQPPDTFNSNFMLFTGFCVIGMALATFYHFYTDEKFVKLTTNPHFRISLVFLFYWSCTFISYAFHETLEEAAFQRVYIFIWLVNLVTYASLGFVFRRIRNKGVSHA